MPHFKMGEHWTTYDDAIVCSQKHADRAGEIVELILQEQRLTRNVQKPVELMIVPSFWAVEDECFVISNKEFLGVFDFEELMK